MHRAIAIILSSLILVQSLNLTFQDFIQLDEFIEHAQFHKQEYGDNFWSFISKHYGELKTEHDGEHQDHDQLPLKQQCIASINVLILQQYIKKYKLIIPSEEQDQNFFYRSSHSLFQKQSLLQPPQNA